MPRPLRIVLFALALGFMLSACQANVLVETKLNASGGGTFTLSVTLDREARLGAAAATDASGGSGTGSLVAMFDRLRARGWTVASAEPEGGLKLSATRAFADSAAFDQVLSDLRAPEQDPSVLATPAFSLDFKTKRSFFRTRSTFTGSFDTEPADTPANAQLRAALEALRRAGALDFEVRAQLPGAVHVGDSDGTVVGDSVVWRPELGTAARFLATSSALRVGSVLLVILPGLLLLCALAWALLGRRAHHEPLAIIPEPAEQRSVGSSGAVPAAVAPTTIVLEPEPVEQLLAIERDPIDS